MEKKALLTSRDRIALIAQHRVERDKRVCDRIKAVLLYDDGYSYTTIAKILLLDDETIRRHIQDYKVHEKLSSGNGGSTSLLNVSQTEALLSHLQERLYTEVKDICAYVKKQFKIAYSVSGMTKWLKSHGFRYKKPQGIPGKFDAAKQKEFLSYYEELKQEAGVEEPIYFVDSVHPEHQTRLSYGWIFKGKRKPIRMTNKQYRINIMGGICLTDHRIVYEQADKVNEDSIQSFLYRLRKKHPGRYQVHVIWDNAGYHRSKAVQAFAKELGMVLHYLPPYSPNLNPIERLWKILHEQVTRNRYYSTFADFKDAIKHFFQYTVKKKSLLKSRINDNFQIIKQPNLAS